MNPLDVPFEQLTFPLSCSGKVYTVKIEQLCSRPLHEGLLEHSYQDPEDPIIQDLLLEFRQEELSEIEDLKERLTGMWRRDAWTVLTPTPHHAATDFQRGEGSSEGSARRSSGPGTTSFPRCIGTRTANHPPTTPRLASSMLSDGRRASCPRGSEDVARPRRV